jgi:uncharacterized membrane protein YeaQ/YmgE (transglycosylase-associated protein family)
MFDDMLSGFMNSQQGRDALTALQKQGIPAGEAQNLLNHAVPAAAESMKQATAGQSDPAVGLFNIFGGHSGRSFLEGMVAGLVRGDGLVGSLEDGGMGMIGGHVAEVIAQRTGMDSSRASMIASVATPFIVHYIHTKLANR